MSASAQFLNPSAAAQRLGVSAKALRLYERHGLITPSRTAAGWRVYGPDEMARAAEIVALRALGLSLSQVARVLGDDPQGLEPALAAHQTILEGRIRQLTGVVEKVRDLRADLAQGKSPTARELARLLGPPAEFSVAFDLPWPWGGERFELRDVRPLNYIIGPLGSGKTRLAKRLAETLPDAVFLGLDRLEHGGAAARAQLDADPALKSRVDQTLAWLVEDGAAASEALVALLVGLESEGAAIVVVDMVEQGLDQAAQEALIANLRRRGPGARSLFLLTRSCAILDLAAVGAEEAIIFCPGNHSPPISVAPYPGASGYEAVATCLASPEVRARTEGVIAWRPQVA
ncbi:MAG: MerR family transcriptional regulator [Xanthobacteraceae bacterium]